MDKKWKRALFVLLTILTLGMITAGVSIAVIAHEQHEQTKLIKKEANAGSDFISEVIKEGMKQSQADQDKNNQC